MKIISLQVGLSRTVHTVNRDVTTSIFKSPVRGPRLLRRLNLDGDLQSDLTVHGGKNKAVYAYPLEHYEYWRKELPGVELTGGNFGENFTTEGLMEENARIGDRFRIGGAVVKVSQPRFPCYKLGIRFDRVDMVKRFWASKRSGIYFSVVEEGLVDAGDTFERIHEDERRLSIADINSAYENPRDNLALIQRIVSLEVLPSGLHDEFADVLASLKA
jgi:MOSC domain-containing protein YiiM